MLVKFFITRYKLHEFSCATGSAVALVSRSFHGPGTRQPSLYVTRPQKAWRFSPPRVLLLQGRSLHRANCSRLAVLLRIRGCRSCAHGHLGGPGRSSVSVSTRFCSNAVQSCFWGRRLLRCRWVRLLAAPALAASAPFARAHFGEPDTLSGPLLLVAASMPIIAVSVVPGSKDLRRLKNFRWAAGYALVELVGHQLLIVMLALLASFLAFTHFLFNTAGVRLTCGVLFAENASCTSWKGQLKTIRYFLKQESRSAVQADLAIDQGDYLLLGLLRPPRAVGYYFAPAFRMAACVRVVAGNLQSILFSTLTQFGADKRRMVVTAFKSAEALSYVVYAALFHTGCRRGSGFKVFVWREMAPVYSVASDCLALVFRQKRWRRSLTPCADCHRSFRLVPEI